MYENTSYDTTKFSNSLFGDYTFAREKDFQTFVDTNGLPYNCFYDDQGGVKHFFEDQTGSFVGNDIFAIMPSGIMKKYNLLLEESFEEWIHNMYEEAYPN